MCRIKDANLSETLVQKSARDLRAYHVESSSGPYGSLGSRASVLVQRPSYASLFINCHCPNYNQDIESQSRFSGVQYPTDIHCYTVSPDN